MIFSVLPFGPTALMSLVMNISPPTLILSAWALYSATSLFISSRDSSNGFSRYSVAWYTVTRRWWISPINWPMDFLAIRPNISRIANSMVARGIPSARPLNLKLRLYMYTFSSSRSRSRASLSIKKGFNALTKIG
ncbi:hypothetical protein ES703_54544 [subsurface metagenome]